MTQTAAAETTSAAIVIGIFRDRHDADRAVIELREVEFHADTIGTAYREGPSRSAIEHQPDGSQHEDAILTPGQPAARRIAEPVDINYEPANRPSPAFEPDYETGDENVGASEGSDLTRALQAAGVGSEQAGALARKLQPGAAVVTVRTSDRAAEAEAILKRNNATIGL
ncbi:MAG TPA: hypothetical protein VGD59_09800 [Acidisarcina sp.]